ncbi:MAG: iron-sulfur cluster repair di-iron protein [Candidatus Woesearchaeota archaeon]|nr:MAG: iron-sulfur cluster repair di-iron protein [Candidatus Woesearchaeota archaeon]
MEEKLISELVTEDYRTASIFKKHGIDFCCGGKITLTKACEQKGINKTEIIEEIKKLNKEESKTNKPEDLELDSLAEHIVNKHHTYVRKRIPEIEPFLTKLVRVHGEKHPELQKTRKIFNEIKDELTTHMQKEESILFPYIKKLVQEKKEGNTIPQSPFGTIKNPIQMMEQEHEQAGNGFKEIRTITNNLIPPEDACNTYRVTFSMLAEFEDDLHRHIHLENNVLFPKAIELEDELLTRG